MEVRAGRVFEIVADRPSRLTQMLRVVKAHQWWKNALVLLPLTANQGLADGHQWRSSAIAAVAVLLLASAAQVVAALLAVEVDRSTLSEKSPPLAVRGRRFSR